MCSLDIGMVRVLAAVTCLLMGGASESPAQQRSSTTQRDSLRRLSHEKYYEEFYRSRPELLGVPATPGAPVPTSPFVVPNVNISVDTFPQNEPSIAISHKDPNRMVAAWRDFRTGVTPAVRRVGYSYSSDGGVTWSPSILLPSLVSGFPRNSDPAVCVDTSGIYYLSTIALDSTDNNLKIFVYILSEDGNFLYGGYFAPSDTADPFYDKEYIACDLSPSSLFANNLYIAYNAQNGIGFTRSTNGGITWSHQISISDSGQWHTAPDIAIGVDGSVNVAWSKTLGGSDSGFVQFTKSTDGGLTFSMEVPIDSAYPQHSVSYRGNFPSIASDISRRANSGNLYVVWSDRRNGDLDVFLSFSQDGGITWSKARRVNDDPIGNGKHQFWPWVAVDDRGVVSIVYYDTRNTPDSTIAETYIAYSWDGGRTFTNQLISSAQSPQSMPNGDVRFGDYIGLDAWGGHTVPVWTDERAGGYNMDIYTATLDTLPMVNFSGVGLSFARGWNLISLSVLQSHSLVTQIFPSTLSPAYSYEGGGYQVKDSIKIGIGYWIRSSSDQRLLVSGDTLDSDTIDVVEGWNLIGSVTNPVVAASISSDPPGMTTSQIFGFLNGGYVKADTLLPGLGYWVKAGQAGKLVVGNSGTTNTPIAAIQRTLTDVPPPPPTGEPSVDIRSKTYALEQAFPNPFNPTTQINYALPEPGRVLLRVYNVLGQQVRTLVDEVQSAGYKTIEFDGNSLPSGVYFYRFQAGSFSRVMKMILIR